MTASPSPSLLDLFETSVANHDGRPLFQEKHGGKWIATTYAEFARLVEAVRAGLAGLGVEPGSRVGLISGNRVEWAAVAYAAYGLRAAVVPMYESQQTADWEFVIRDAAVRVLFVSNSAVRDKLIGRTKDLATLRHLVLLDGPETQERQDGQGGQDGQDGQEASPTTFRSLAATRARVPVQRPTSEDVAALLYTSGTTAVPKGVVLTHGNIVSNVSAVLGMVPVAPRHRTLSFLPWAHAFGHTVELHAVMAAGASMAIAESIDKITDNLAEVRPTVLVAVPRVFLRVHASVNALLATKPRPIRWLARRGLELSRRASLGQPLTSIERLLRRLADVLIFSRVRRRVGGRLEFAISGAAALPKEVAEMIDGLGIPVYEGYGLTEASPIVSANVPGHRKLGSVGRPLPGVRVVIDRTVTGAGEDGEIIVYGPNVMRGYHDRPDETRLMLTEDGGLRTGDLGRLDDEGYLHVTGRIKEQYKLTNGKYVSPGLLEERLKLSPFIADVMVCGEDREHNVALVVPDLAAVRAWAARAEVPVDGQEAEALLRHPLVIGKMAAEIQELSRGFRGYERIAAFSLLAEGFTQQNGMLTPSLKLKRRAIVARWRQELDRLHAQSDPAAPPARRGVGA